MNGPSNLRSVAESLSNIHRRESKPGRHVTLTDKNPAYKLRPGRYRCECQARIHGLIRNCMGCGRIVCEQEGSGPCVFCGELVCTREEREMLNSKSKKALLLYTQLMSGKTQEDTSNEGSVTLASLGSALLKAEEFRNKLLEADADRDKRTQVNDLESDYYSMENSAFLTKEERDAIIARKEDLKAMREKRRRNLLVDLDLSKGKVTEQRQEQFVREDPVIQSILDKSRQRQAEANSATRPVWVPPSFIPKYDAKYGRKNVTIPVEEDMQLEFADDGICATNEDIMYAEVERKGFAICIMQPLASLLARGCRRHIPWNDDVDLRGPVFIASAPRNPSKEIILKEEQKCWEFIRKATEDSNDRCSQELPLEYPCGSFVGRALLTDCLSIEEYREQHPLGECSESDSAFILTFSIFEPLLVPIPHLPPSQDAKIYRLDKNLRKAIKQILDPYNFS